MVEQVLKISETSVQAAYLVAVETRLLNASLINTGDLSSCSLKSLVVMSEKPYIVALAASLKYKIGAEAANAP